jgi:N-acetylneuraminic acid mutarotase
VLRAHDGTTTTLALEPISKPDGPLAMTAAPAADSCSQAPTLLINDGGSTTNIRNFNAVVDGSDPILSCMWGNPADKRGYRTAWYKFEPEAYGLVSLTTLTSNYDTVIAVHKGACGALLEVACNDDDNYWSSRVDLQVQAGETYYVEVAHWHSAASGQMVLNLRSEPQPIQSQWETATAGSALDSFRSRHAVVADGSKLYVIAGQTSIGTTPDRTPSMYVYDTATGSTQALSRMRGGSDQLGYSNTTAALVDGHIYMPAGFTGINDGTHWVYDISNDQWSASAAADNNWASAQPAIYSQATSYRFDVPPGNGYFLSGGMTGVFPISDSSTGWSPRSELYFYSVDSNTWLQLNSMPIGRLGHVAAKQSINGQDHICVAGGMGGSPGSNRETLNSTYCFNVNLGTWSQFASLSFERHFASSAVDAQGNWYVFGGYDDAGNLVGVTERYDRLSDQWIVLGASYSVVPPRAWSRGAYVGNTLWIIGGEISNQNVVNIVQKAVLFRGSQLNYLPILSSQEGVSQRNDTVATARELAFPASILDNFYTAFDIVNFYSFDVPAPRQPVRIRLDHLGSSNHLDLVLYTDNKGIEAISRQPGTVTEDITVALDPGRYYLAVERTFPLIGQDPSSGQYLLQVLTG